MIISLLVDFFTSCTATKFLEIESKAGLMELIPDGRLSILKTNEEKLARTKVFV